MNVIGSVLPIRFIAPFSVVPVMSCPVNWPAFGRSKKTWNTVFTPLSVPDIAHGPVEGHNCTFGVPVAVYVPEIVPSELWVSTTVTLVRPAAGPAENHVPETLVLAACVRGGPQLTVASADDSTATRRAREIRYLGDKWALQDSNLRPSDYESAALTD